MPSVAVVGGGLAGLAATAALADAGYSVRLFESRAFLGGRAASYPVPGADAESVVIDNCQHVLLRCCVNLLDFYRRLGVERLIRFERTFHFVEPGGRVSVLERGLLPTPLHFAGSFARLRCLSLSDKISIARAILSLRREYSTREDLDRITMLDWLREKRQTQRAIARFWGQVLVSAINEDLDRMAARHGFQVFQLGFLATSDGYEMGVPAVALGDLYAVEAWARRPNVALRFRSSVDRVMVREGRAAGVQTGPDFHAADAVVIAVPFERVNALVPEAGLDFEGWQHSPITGIHLWFDRPVTTLAHATLLDRTIQWMFNKGEGRYLQLVVSASRSLVDMPRAEVLALATRELAEFFPEVLRARVERAHVVKELRATFSASPGLEARRPVARTGISNLFLAGDWTRSGWPATMEGAVRSGYLVAEAVTEAFGRPARFLKAG